MSGYGDKEMPIIMSIIFITTMLSMLYCDTEAIIGNGNQNEDSRPWIAGFVSVSIINIVSMIGVVIIPLRKFSVFNILTSFFMAMALGSLLGDAMIHLVPQSFQIHNHENHHDHEEHNSSAEHSHDTNKINGYIIQGAVICASIILLRSFEFLGNSRAMNKIIKVLFNRECHSQHVKHHHHRQSVKSINNELDSSTCHDTHRKLSDAQLLENSVDQTQIVVCNQTLHENIENCRLDKIVEDLPCENSNCRDVENCKGVETLPAVLVVGSVPSHIAVNENVLTRFIEHLDFHKIPRNVWFMVVGDIFHNFIDGLIIGSSFTVKWPSGFSSGVATSLSIICHELPHELGDFATMLNLGVHFKMAIVLNIISSLSAYLGVFIGTASSSNIYVNMTLNSISAAMFLYIALTILMPIIVEAEKNNSHPYKMFIIHSFGMILGVAVMVILAIFGENIHV